MNDDVKQATNIVKMIRKLLYNYDLALVEAKGQYDLRQAAIKRYSQDGRKFAIKKKLSAKIDVDRLERYIAEIESKRQEILDNLSLVQDNYNAKYKQVFTMFFVEDKTYDEIATATNYSKEAIKKIVQRLKNDILEIFVVE